MKIKKIIIFITVIFLVSSIGTIVSGSPEYKNSKASFSNKHTTIETTLTPTPPEEPHSSIKDKIIARPGEEIIVNITVHEFNKGGFIFIRTNDKSGSGYKKLNSGNLKKRGPINGETVQVKLKSLQNGSTDAQVVYYYDSNNDGEFSMNEDKEYIGEPHGYFDIHVIPEGQTVTQTPAPTTTQKRNGRETVKTTHAHNHNNITTGEIPTNPQTSSPSSPEEKSKMVNLLVPIGIVICVGIVIFVASGLRKRRNK